VRVGPRPVSAAPPTHFLSSVDQEQLCPAPDILECIVFAEYDT
jgi:hypothetical protein